MSGARRRGTGAVLALTGSIVIAVSEAPARAAAPAAVTVDITRLVALQDPDPTQGDGDYYARIIVDGHAVETGEVSGVDFDPNWTVTVDVARTKGVVPVEVRVFDADFGAAEPDDVIDIDPVDKNVNLDLLFDLTTGQWWGDVPLGQGFIVGDGDTEHFASTEGGEAGRIEFAISTDTSVIDGDGDGLVDDWEVNGYDDDGDGVVDVDLPAMGADPTRKDLFLELDYSPDVAIDRGDIQEIKHAFAVAPLPNPSGPPGVNLWVDMGTRKDVGLREGQLPGTCADGIDNSGPGGAVDGADGDCDFLNGSVEDPGPGNCDDGMDNDGDGRADAPADSDCLVGDDLGGGNSVDPLFNCGIDDEFYAAKKTNFDPARAMIFRYAISTSSSPICDKGGQGELGGNDFIDHTHDGQTLMHELGHTLGLQHGGEDGDNCKPNHVSIMNYSYPKGLFRVGGGHILDYSPPRIDLDGSTRGMAPLPTLDESQLDETVPQDPTDGSNRFAFVDGGQQARLRVLDEPTNWDGSTGASTSVQVNVDTAGFTEYGGPWPEECENSIDDTILSGSHDWNRVTIPFRASGDSADGPINPETGDPTLAELEQTHDLLTTTDVGVTLSDSPDPVGAGETLVYTVIATNNGPNPAPTVEVTTTLAPGVSLKDTSLPCANAGAVVVCSMGDLEPGDHGTLTIRVDVPGNLAYANGGPKTITATAAVDNLAGPDPNPANDSDSEDTLVTGEADVGITGASHGVPAEVLVGQLANATVDVTVANRGPSSPIDTVLAYGSASSPGLVVTPPAASTYQAALAVGSPQTVRNSIQLKCQKPGKKVVTLKYQLSLANAADVEPNTADNQATVTFTVECVMPVAINVRPGGYPNSINLHTDATLAVLTTAPGQYGLPLAFDAASIDPLSVRWGRRANLLNSMLPKGAQEVHGKGHVQDSYELDERTRDRDRDMVLHFKPADSGLTSSTTEGCVKGRFVGADGGSYTFFGCDSVRIRP